MANSYSAHLAVHLHKALARCQANWAIITFRAVIVSIMYRVLYLKRWIDVLEVGQTSVEAGQEVTYVIQGLK